LPSSLQPAVSNMSAQSELNLFQNHAIVWHPKAVEAQGNLEARAGPDKSSYHFCLQKEGQPAQLSQGEDCLKVNCSRIVQASDLFCGARSDYQYHIALLFWSFGTIIQTPLLKHT